LDYFNSAEAHELVQITGCSEIKAVHIIKSRPFHAFDDLKLNKINQKIIDGCLEILVIKENLSQLLKKCEKISFNLTQRIRPLLDNVELNSSLETENLILQQPHYLNSE